LSHQKKLTMTKLDKINSDKEYDDAVIFMNNLLDTVGNDEAHPLAATLERIGILVSDYEQLHYKL
jgi:HTH-type transcriptional regulator / antitoxin HigA